MIKKIMRNVLGFVLFFSFIGLLAIVYALTQPDATEDSTSDAVIESNSDLYITEEFKQGNEISMVYICAITGHKTGMAEDGLALLVMFNEYTKMGSQKTGNLLDDANTWWEEESYAWDLDGLWDGACEQPLNNIRRTL